MMCVVRMVQESQGKAILGQSVARKGELQSAAHFHEYKLTSECREVCVEMCAITATVDPAKCPISQSSCRFNLLKTKRRPLYLKTQFVPRCKHFSSRL